MPINLSFHNIESTGSFYTRIHASQRENILDQSEPPTVIEWRQWLHENYPNGGKGLKCLDAGCGLNAFAGVLCAKHGFDQVHAVDINPDVEPSLMKNPEAAQIQFRQASVMDLPYSDESFDLVICQGVAHHTPDPKKSIAELVRVCKPGGTVFFVLYCFKNSPFLLLVRAMRYLGRLLTYETVQTIARKSPTLNNFVMDHMFVPILWVFSAYEVRSLLADCNLDLVKERVADFDIFQKSALTRWISGDGLFREFVCQPKID